MELIDARAIDEKMTPKSRSPGRRVSAHSKAPARPFNFARVMARMNALADLVEAHASVKQLEAAEVDIR